MEWHIGFITLVFALFLLMVLGVPIAVSMATVAFFGLVLLIGIPKTVLVFGIIVYICLENFLLVAIPMFILMAEILIMSGLTPKIYDALEKILGVVPGGLLLSTIAASTVLAALCGSSIAATSTLASVAIPEMKKRGYDGRLAVGAIAAGGGLAIIIPPSMTFILYGFIAEISVATLFVAGVVPGLLMATFYSIWTIFVAKRYPKLVPRLLGFPWKRRIMATLTLWPVVILIVMVMGTIYLGIATPTEAASLGVLGVLVVSLGYRRLNLKGLFQALMATVRTTGFVLFIIVGALLLGYLITYLGVAQNLSKAIVGAGLNPYVVLIAINIMLLLLGCVMEASSLILVITPLILPTLLPLGFNPFVLGIILCINIEMALCTPPVGMNLFILQGFGKEFGIGFSDVVKGALPYLFGDAVVIGLVMLFPQLALWLPSLMPQ